LGTDIISKKKERADKIYFKDFIHYEGSGVSHEYAPCEFSYCFIMVYMSLLTMIVDPWFIIRCPLSPQFKF
jgi:hypothetical protein